VLFHIFRMSCIVVPAARALDFAAPAGVIAARHILQRLLEQSPCCAQKKLFRHCKNILARNAVACLLEMLLNSNRICRRERTYGWMVRWTLVSPAHLFLDLFQDFRRCTFSGRRRPRRRRGVYGDFVNLKMICRLSLLKVLIGVGCTCMHS
jgi:hypothetical protein